jgi:hypothetical protein
MLPLYDEHALQIAGVDIAHPMMAAALDWQEIC